MVTQLARHWWAMAIRGVIAIVIGLIAFIWPGIAVAALVMLFGVFMFLDGIFAVVAAVQERATVPHWWALLIEGIAGIVAGLIVWALPGLAALVLIYFIAAWALITGIMEIIAAIRLREQIEGEWRLALSGVLSVILAVLLVISPLGGILALAWLLGAYAILFGVVLLALAFHLKGFADRRATGPAPA
ncbi:MAG TPA: HdeD family acid-resistance protein [Chloroflexota bacterium]|nr:HdeD family acid-resistance protein [Chloroflexota bacterium]